MKVNQRQLGAVMTLFSGASTAKKLIAGVTLLLAVGAYFAQADNGEISGVVVGVADGDTITVLDAAQQQHKIRFAFIDAPEKAQPYGQRAKQLLAARVYRQVVKVDVVEKDRYGRIVGRVWQGTIDVNLAQLKDGYAWHYRYYASKNQSAEDFSRYEAAERQARGQRLGLWEGSAPQAPWEFRRSKRGN
ncbi:thermonuclease family protein [Pseudogulbenkiania sp. NH8B]|uniref:thermonuclease family protein n=1 Tax=Pseudogulbenkiania sp. (strain NH8B) TaxID=748280 RepID=UPI00059F0357|nr:thermonuclease family protein [Pseudogulbenkiania sp. NH8B]